MWGIEVVLALGESLRSLSGEATDAVYEIAESEGDSEVIKTFDKKTLEAAAQYFIDVRDSDIQDDIRDEAAELVEEIEKHLK